MEEEKKEVRQSPQYEFYDLNTVQDGKWQMDVLKAIYIDRNSKLGEGKQGTVYRGSCVFKDGKQI